MKIELTPKQAQYIREADCRWNIAEGAWRSGKSHLAVQYLIPSNIMERRGKKGLNVLFGATLGNIERNVLTPMREIWGAQAVGEIKSNSTGTFVELFGDKAYCIGIENAKAKSRVRGSEIKYAYCDELCDTNEEVFELVQSRLSLDYSRCDASCNPEGPKHFVKRFIDTPNISLYHLTYTIYDNPFISKDYVRDLEAKYAGTVYFDRYILGLWKQTDGLVYPFDNESDFTCTYDEARGWDGENEARGYWAVSIDYGTVNPFAAILWRVTPDRAYAVDEYYYDGHENQPLTDEEHYANLERLIDGRSVQDVIIDPSAGSFKQTIWRHGRYSVLDADNSVLDGIMTTSGMLRTGRIKISTRCENTIEEIGMYSWDKKADTDKVIKEYDHAMDSMRYMAFTKLQYMLKGYI